MDNSDLLKSQLEVDATGTAHLLETAKWAKFLSIVGFVMCGVVALIGVFFSAFMSFFSRFSEVNLSGFGGLIAGVYILIAIFLLIPNLFLFRFATKMKIAVQSTDQLVLNESLNQHRRYYKFIGICTIIAVAFYVLIFLLALAGNLLR